MTEAQAAPTTAKPKAKAPPEIQVRVSWCKGCGLCVDYCNRGVLVMKEELPVVVAAEKCTRCMLCEAICPDFAIAVVDGPAATGGAIE
jgi:2-oxoglutarate ferredoxin oxidoreductase subunit delta